MLRNRQKRKVIFTNPQSQASSSKAAPTSAAVPLVAASTSGRDRSKSKQSRDSARASKRASQQSSNTPAKVSNRQRRLASLFMALMASSPLPIETDAETLEAAQKASVAPKASAGTKHKGHVSTIRVQEVRAGRWKRFRYELSLKTMRGKEKRMDEIELGNLVEPSGQRKRWG